MTDRPAIDDRALRSASILSARDAPHDLAFFEHALGYARQHAEVIDRFGRFPHRNAPLSRPSSPEEEAYLRAPDAGF